MQCDYFDAHRCRSCTLMGTSYDHQVTDKQQRCVTALSQVGASPAWEQPFLSAPQGFRNKAKLVIGGTREAPTVGILDHEGAGVDLRHCGLYEPGLAQAVQEIPGLISALGLVPYAVPRRSGELKHVLLTHSPEGELMVRFVLRSEGQVVRVRDGLPLIRERLPGARVVSVNLQPAHAAVLEGPDEIVLTPEEELPMQVNDVRLRLRTRSFFQTNTVVAAGLYRQARDWIDVLDPDSLWDLYCGVGGFALHTRWRPDGTPRDVLGVEVSAEAIASARATAAELLDAPQPGTTLSGGASRVLETPRFIAGDAQALLGDRRAAERPVPELVVVNPPRRGIGADLAGGLETSGVEHVLYSSCNVDSLAKDLAAMPSLRPVRARLFDMFPQTPHLEVLTLLQRR